ncbi:MAG TPA: DUF1990 domain-containing protein [Gemmataceae bacterium]|nr:DUF1990 domain-containing protein [Gemmataceae bacterium]
MLWLRKPSGVIIANLMQAQAPLDFSYPAVGASAGQPPAGYIVDHTRINLGRGERVFKAARAALERWDHMRLGWLEASAPGPPTYAGQVVATLARSLGLWWLNVCRVVYVVEVNGPVEQFGFAYGTLPAHLACGEERFAVEWDRASDAVCYDISAFSRPRHLLARLGYPWMRMVQKRFGRDSARALARAVERSVS